MLRVHIFSLLMWLPLTVSVANENHGRHSDLCGIPGGGDEIIVYDLWGGMMPRTSEEPQLTVHANGNVILGNPYGTSRRIEAHIDQARLQQLLDFIAERNGFFDIDVPAIHQQIREEQHKTGRLFAIADAGESLIRVCSGEHQKEVKFYALSHAYRQFPKIPALQRLYAIERELKRTATWVRIGGDEGAQANLALVNEHLAHKYPDIEPLSLENLDAVVTGADGSVTVYFSRRGFEQQGAHLRNFSAIVYHPYGNNTKPTITVNLE